MFGFGEKPKVRKITLLPYEVTNIVTGEHDTMTVKMELKDYITNEGEEATELISKTFHLAAHGHKTSEQLDSEGWYPGNRDDLIGKSLP